jgi:16S rRNA (cytidine1402-2'-O)-methyltransferase
MTGLLILAATPIGNPGDATDRLREALATADIVAAEDTRRLHRLASMLDVHPTGSVVSYYDAVEAERTPGLLASLQAGATVLLLTDAGTPSISDPGLLALTVSGLPVDRFAFEGFLPRKSGERRRRLRELAADPRTLVFFEAPHRLAPMLADLVAEFGADRSAAVCRELTKTYEEVRRGPLSELADWSTGDVRGEITVVVAGAVRSVSELSGVELAAAVAEREAVGTDRKTAIAEVAVATGQRKSEVYAAVVARSKPEVPGP